MQIYMSNSVYWGPLAKTEGPNAKLDIMYTNIVPNYAQLSVLRGSGTLTHYSYQVVHNQRSKN